MELESIIRYADEYLGVRDHPDYPGALNGLQVQGRPDVRHVCAAVDASEAEGWVEYKAADGLVFRNGPWGLTSFTSRELHAASPELLRHAEFMAIRAKHAGVIVEDVEEAA